MKKTVNGLVFECSENINANGTHLQGEIDVDYKVLKKVFGMPTDGDGYKVDAKWTIKFEDGTVATIYNYKDGKNYMGSQGLTRTKIRDWYIGGFDQKSVEYVKIVLDLKD